MQHYADILNILDERDRCCCIDCEELSDCDDIYNAKEILKKIKSHLEKHNCIDDKCQELVSLDESLNRLMVKLEECAWRHADVLSRF